MKTAEEQRIVRERDDLAMMKNPNLWPAWPVLPIKKRNSKGGFPESAFLIEAQDYKFVVVHGNIFRMSEEGYFKTCKITKFDSFEDIISAGYTVD